MDKYENFLFRLRHCPEEVTAAEIAETVEELLRDVRQLKEWNMTLEAELDLPWMPDPQDIKSRTPARCAGAPFCGRGPRAATQGRPYGKTLRGRIETALAGLHRNRRG